ncbi:MAG: hypothetical protein WBB45_08555 [Cyclobacteriaceae bacterium]
MITSLPATYLLSSSQLRHLTGGTGETSGGTTGSNGGGSGEPDLPPPVWPDDTTSARMSYPTI